MIFTDSIEQSPCGVLSISWWWWPSLVSPGPGRRPHSLLSWSWPSCLTRTGSGRSYTVCSRWRAPVCTSPGGSRWCWGGASTSPTPWSRELQPASVTWRQQWWGRDQSGSHLVVLECDGLASLRSLEGPVCSIIHLVEPVICRIRVKYSSIFVNWGLISAFKSLHLQKFWFMFTDNLNKMVALLQILFIFIKFKCR